MNALLRFPAMALSGALFATAVSPVRSEDSAPPPVTVRIDVDRAVLPADRTEKAVVKVALDCVAPPRRGDRPPVNLALVLDRSGSMSGDKIVKAREAALEAVGRLGPDDVVSFVAYDNRIETLVPAQRVGDGRRLREAIRRIEPNGGTALYGGVVRGAEEVRRNLEDRRFFNRVILLSDGLANVGPSSPDELARLGAELRREGISVTTIGLGLGFNEDLMTRLAQRSDGNTYFVEHSGDLPRILTAEVGEVLNVVARRVVVEIEFPRGVRPLRIVGRDGTIRGRTAELTLNQLYGGQEKYALVEVEVQPEAAGREREIARATVTYEDALQLRSVTQTAKRQVTFSASERAVIGSADHRVQTAYAANELALAKDAAIALADAGRRTEAAEVLRRKAEEIGSAGAAYGNTQLKVMATAAAPAAARIETEGFSAAERKEFRADSAQVRSQQTAGRSPERP